MNCSWGLEDSAGLGLPCRSNSRTRSMVRSGGGSCYGDQRVQARTSVVLIFGRPSDAVDQEEVVRMTELHV